MNTRSLWIIAVTSGLLLTGCQADPMPTGSSVAGDDGEATVFQQPVLQLEVGTCLMDVSTPLGQDLSEIPLIDCDRPHESEVFAEVVLEGTGFPGVDRVTEAAVGSCMREFAQFVGIDHAASTLDFAYYYPTPSSWAVGDRSVFCVVFEPGALTEGTLEGSRR
jgi:hypothetical protein